MTVLPSSRPLASWCFAVGYCFFTVACAVAAYWDLRAGDEAGPVVVAVCWAAPLAAGLALFLNLRSRLLGLGLPARALAEAVVCDWRFFVLGTAVWLRCNCYRPPAPVGTAVRVLAALVEFALLAAIMDTRSSTRPALKGALADRIAGLARTGSLRARKVYVADQNVPGWSRMLARKAVILTPGVLDSLSRREIDAIAARQMNHPANGRLFLALLAFTLLYAAYGMQNALALLVILFLEAACVAGFIARSDLVANRRASALTGDPVALITALAKLDPGRAGRIAAQVGIDKPRLATLLANQSGPGDRYALD